MKDRFDHNLQTQIANALVRNDVYWENATKNLAKIPADRAAIEEWMFDLEQEFKETAGEYIDYEIHQMSKAELIDFVKKNMHDRDLENAIQEQTYNECATLEELENSKDFDFKTTLEEIVYWSLTEVDYIESNPFVENILYDFSGKVFDKIGSDEQKKAYYK